MILLLIAYTCVCIKSFVRVGPALTAFLCFVLLVDEGKEDPNTTKSGSLSACQQNAI